MKKIIICIVCTFVAFVFSGCVDKKANYTEKLILEEQTTMEQVNASSIEYKKTIALVMKTQTNPFFIDMEKGARRAESEFGVNLLVRTGAQETSIEQQIAIVEEMIDLKVDAIVIAPAHSAELIPILKKAQDANIVIVNIDNRLNQEISYRMGLTGVPFISIDNEHAAYQAVKYISSKIIKPTKAIILEGFTGAYNSEQRKKGALKAYRENPNIELVAIESASWKIDEAFSVTSQIFKKYPDIGAIFCANDMMALGAIEFLAKANKNDVMVAGFDALEEARKAIKKGSLQVSISQQADIQGYTGVAYAVKLLQGEKVPLETIIPIKIVSAEELE